MKTRLIVLARVCGALGLTLVYASSGLGQGGYTISGTVFAAPGKNLAGAAVIACLFENGTCSETRSKVVPIQGSGPRANFQVDGLEAAPYLVLAWRDLNANGDVEAGDELAVYTRNGKPQFLAPPVSKLELRLQVFTGSFEALFGQAQPSSAAPPNPAPASPAANDARALVGAWGTTRTSPVDLVSPSGTVVSGGGSAISYRFEADGRYSYAGVLETNGPVLFLKDAVYEEGQYTVKGDVLTLQYRRRARSWNGGKLQSDATSSGTDAFRWSIGPASSNDGTLALYLIDKAGTKLEYPRQ